MKVHKKGLFPYLMLSFLPHTTVHEWTLLQIAFEMEIRTHQRMARQVSFLWWWIIYIHELWHGICMMCTQGFCIFCTSQNAFSWWYIFSQDILMDYSLPVLCHGNCIYLLNETFYGQQNLVCLISTRSARRTLQNFFIAGKGNYGNLGHES